ncbi:flavin-containing monooxygenase FMO GS-OX5-like [Macadamia integrifolia]|uniref:flavin-containing monooxygenase FMO GS-OX5-like n=1 Tax=Macadamia integrifolia TaxID=60698 RepID=UPI001C4E8EF9|nr:flavin-containing monooxygenase FMO GS-OX5-like [Macadamia integrifolia]
MASGGGSSSSSSSPSKVAVVGAGPCGLVAARELRREGQQLVMFEKGDRIGGTWVYDPRLENLPLSRSVKQDEEGVGVDVHSSMYRSLRINFPRQMTGFLDYPFLKESHGGDSRTYPRREEVLSYLDDFAGDFRLVELIRFRSEVVRVERNHGRPDGWIVQSSTSESEELETEVFDAVVVCNGQDTVPRFAEIPGIDKWPGKQIHSHNYRIPEPFRDQEEERYSVCTKVVSVQGNGRKGRSS